MSAPGAVVGEPVPTAVRERPVTLARRVMSSIRRDPYAVVGMIFLGFLIAVAVFGPAFAPFEGAEIVRDDSGGVKVLQPPSREHLLGTSAFGRDVLSQMIYGTRPVMIVGFACAIIPTAFGYLLGLMAGYLRGGVDMLISRTVEVWYAIPSDPFAIVLLVILQPSLTTLIVAISITYWRRPTRVVRNQVMTLSQSPFIKSARVAGGSSRWIITRHLVPLTLPLAFVYIPIGFANAVLAEASLSFLGFGDPNLVSWGGIMRDAFNGGALQDGWWWIVAPGLAITLTAVSIFLVTRPIEEVIDPRLKSTKES